jgi:hypothetical protein
MSAPREELARELEESELKADDMPDDDFFEAADTSSGRRVAGPPACIQLHGEHLSDDIDKAGGFLTRDPDIYAQGPQLVRVMRAEATNDAGTLVEGTPFVRPVPLATLRERLTKLCTFQKWVQREKKWIGTEPSDHLIQGLAARGTWPGIRELVGVIESPSIRPDGSVIDAPGYDAATGYLYAPTVAFPEVPAHPQQADAAGALRDLCEVFAEFPFTSEAGRMVPIAALLSVIGRPAIASAVPACLFDASTPGTGKTLVTDAISAVSTGRGAPRCTFPVTNYGKVNVEELEKILGAYALRSPAVVGFDNIAHGGFGGAPLDKYLTSYPTVDVRVLGKSDMPEARWRAVVLGTGNNLAVLDDCVRRVLVGRLETDSERPEERTGFSHYPLLPWVMQERPRLVVAALTILRAWFVAGKPVDPTITPMGGGFEAWEAIVPQAIVYAGGANVILARPGDDVTAADDVGLLATVLDGWERLQGDGDGLTAKSALDLLYPHDRERGGHGGPPDGFELMREAIEELTKSKPGQTPTATAIGVQLRRFKGRVTAGRRLVCVPNRKGVQAWTVQRLSR